MATMGISEILNNNWVVGIGGGLATYLITTIVASFFVRKKQKREYQSKVRLGNSEVVALVRRSLSEGLTPDTATINDLLSSAGRRHEVDRGDLLGLDAIREDLIHEVLDTSFLSASEKKAICEKVRGIIPESQVFESEGLSSLSDEIENLRERVKRQRNSQGEAIIWVIGAMSGLSVALSVIIAGDNPFASSFVEHLLNAPKASFPVSVALVTGVVAIAASMLAMLKYWLDQRRFERRHQKLQGDVERQYREFLTEVTNPASVHLEKK